MAIPARKKSGKNGSWAKGTPFRKVVAIVGNCGTTCAVKLECGHTGLAGYGSKKARCLYCEG
jgi:hypothetical protein